MRPADRRKQHACGHLRAGAGGGGACPPACHLCPVCQADPACCSGRHVKPHLHIRADMQELSIMTSSVHFRVEMLARRARAWARRRAPSARAPAASPAGSSAAYAAQHGAHYWRSGEQLALHCRRLGPELGAILRSVTPGPPLSAECTPARRLRGDLAASASVRPALAAMGWRPGRLGGWGQGEDRWVGAAGGRGAGAHSRRQPTGPRTRPRPAP